MKKLVLLAVLAVFTAGSVIAQTETTEPQKEQSGKKGKKDEKPEGEKKKSGFGNFIRRVGESTTGINMSNETFAVLPARAKALIQMEVVSCIGDSRDQSVLLTLAVKAKPNGKAKIDLGKPCGSGNQDCVTGYDTKGKTFQGQEVGSYSQTRAKETPAGIPVEFQFAFSAVPATLQAFELVQIEFYIYGDSSAGSNMSGVDPIQVRNIPIQWDVENE